MRTRGRRVRWQGCRVEAVLVVAALVVVVLVLAVVLYNRLVRARVRVDEAWAQVETDLQRRHDLIPNLVATVRGYAGHERTALEAVTEARSRALTRRDPAAREAAEDELGAAVGRLLALSETYPDLRADAGFRDLAAELADTETRLAFARDFANHRVATYHQRIETFPGVLVAKAFRFEHRRLFAVDSDAARRVPDARIDGGAPS
jgi:LemA protein